MRRRWWRSRVTPLLVGCVAGFGLWAQIPESTLAGPRWNVNVNGRISRDVQGMFVPGVAWGHHMSETGTPVVQVHLAFQRTWWGSLGGAIRPMWVHETTRFSAVGEDGERWDAAKIEATRVELLQALSHTVILGGSGVENLRSLADSDRILILWRNVAHNTLRSVSGIVLACSVVWMVFLPIPAIWRRSDRRLAAGLCPECGYDIEADYYAGCPECGWNRPS